MYLNEYKEGFGINQEYKWHLINHIYKFCEEVKHYHEHIIDKKTKTMCSFTSFKINIMMI